MKSIRGINRAKYYLIQICSGLLLPLTFFPDWLRTVLEFLPFKIIAYVPLQFYLGKIEYSEFANVFFNQILWIIILWLIGLYFWFRARVRLTFSRRINIVFKSFKIYFYYFSQFLKARMAYRVDFFAGIITNMLVTAVGLLFIVILIDGKTVPSLNGWTRNEVLFIYGYSMISLAIIFHCINELMEIWRSIRN